MRTIAATHPLAAVGSTQTRFVSTDGGIVGRTAEVATMVAAIEKSTLVTLTGEMSLSQVAVGAN